MGGSVGAANVGAFGNDRRLGCTRRLAPGANTQNKAAATREEASMIAEINEPKKDLSLNPGVTCMPLTICFVTSNLL